MDRDFEIFLQVQPGLEDALRAEVSSLGYGSAQIVPGGVTLRGGWPDVWRLNLHSAGAGRVLARIGSFRAMHLAQLDKRARKFPWTDVLVPGIPVRIEASSRKSRLYHQGAIAQRVAGGLEAAGIPVTEDTEVVLRARVDDDLVTFSVDTSGAPLHKRGHKESVGRAPLRETMAALLLRACGYDGAEPVLDPMCGSGTFVIEAAQMARGLAPGRARDFAFRHLATFDADAWAEVRETPTARDTTQHFHGSDRDAGAFGRARENAERAGVGDICDFRKATVSEIVPPDGPPGLVIANPPYGGRIGKVKGLHAVYGALGASLKARFPGWRVGIVTTEAGLAGAMDLPFGPPSAPIAHGGLKVRLWQTKALP